MKIRSQVALLAGAFALGASPAFAIDEVVVTAQRRAENLQEVPLAVSAFDSSTIDRLQINAVKDIGQNVPNLQTYTVTAGAQSMQVFSRGASVQNPAFNTAESPVGIYMDDVYFGRLGSANLELTDIERIEVLRGPQGTLYGRNTIAGAIKLISRTPGDDAWLNASAGYGNYDTLKVTGSVGGPIEDGALAGSLSAVYEDRGRGWQDNPVTGNEPGEHENFVVRGKLHWYGTEGLDIVLSAWGANLENDGYNGVPWDTAPAPAPSGEDSGGPLGGHFYDTLVAKDNVNYGSSDQAGGSINLSYDFGGVTLRSITGLTSTDDQFGFDLAGGGTGTFPLPSPGLETGNNGLLIASDASMNSWSEELQLLGSAFDKRLDWLFGLFYLNEDGHQKYSGHWTVAGPFAISDFTESSQSDTDSYAVFAEGTWHFTDRFSIVAGVRYTDTEKNLDSVCTGTSCVPALDGSNAVHLDDSFDETTFKVGANYQLSDATLLYLSFSQGFQAGGYQTLCLGNMSCAGVVYDSETVDSVEAGVKTELFDRRLRLNAASFYAMYDRMQQTEQRFGAFPQANVGDIDVYGVELEANWTPSDALSIFGHLGWQDSGDYDHLAPTAQAKENYDLPSNPKLQGKIGFLYTMGVSDLVEFFYGADIFYTDDYYTTADNSLKIDSYTRLNGQVGIGAPDQKWQLVLTGRNITDEEDVVSGIYVPGFTNIRTVLPPSEFMLTFKYKY